MTHEFYIMIRKQTPKSDDSSMIDLEEIKKISEIMICSLVIQAKTIMGA